MDNGQIVQVVLVLVGFEAKHLLEESQCLVAWVALGVVHEWVYQYRKRLVPVSKLSGQLHWPTPAAAAVAQLLHHAQQIPTWFLQVNQPCVWF